MPQPGGTRVSRNLNKVSLTRGSNAPRVHDNAPDIVGAPERERAAVDNNSLQSVGVDLGVFTYLFTFDCVHRIEVDLHVARHRGWYA